MEGRRVLRVAAPGQRGEERCKELGRREDKGYNGNRGVDRLSHSTRTQKADETKGF